MINLLPDNAKKEIRAARVNVILTRYILVILMSTAFLGLLLGGSFVFLTQSKASAQSLIDSNGAKAAEYSSTKAQIDALGSGLAETKAALSKEVLFSKVLINIGQQLPAGTILDKIAIDTTSIGGAPITLKAYAKNSDAATALHEKLQASPIFTNVTFKSQTDSGAEVPGYPISISLALSLTKAAAK